MKREVVRKIEYDIVEWNYKGLEEKEVLDRCGLAGWQLICIVKDKAYFMKADEKYDVIYSDD